MGGVGRLYTTGRDLQFGRRRQMGSNEKDRSATTPGDSTSAAALR
jgi:hypothetical protein